MANYVKLGKKARSGSFFEANNQISLFGDKVQKIGVKAMAHSRIIRAINAGHIIKATEEEYKEWLKKMPKDEARNNDLLKLPGKKDSDNNDNDDNDEEVDYMFLHKPELVEYALTFESITEDYTEEEINKMTKSEIQSEISEALTEQEEEEED